MKKLAALLAILIPVVAYGATKRYIPVDGLNAKGQADLVSPSAGYFSVGVKSSDGNIYVTNSAAVEKKLPYSGEIADADIANAAAIAVNKLAAQTASRAVEFDGSGFITPSAVTSTELNYLDGVTSAIQTQIDGKITTVLNDGNIIVGNGSNVAAPVAMSGDATIANTGAVTIANSAVTNAKMASMSESTIKGRAAGAGSGAVTDLTSTQSAAVIGLVHQLWAHQTTPTTPSAGFVNIYAKSDNGIYVMAPDGNETQLAGGGGGGTKSSWAGFHGTDCGGWSRNSSSFGSTATDASCTLTERLDPLSEWTVTSKLSGGDALPGLSFTAPRDGTYRVRARVFVTCASSGYAYGVRLVNTSGGAMSDTDANPYGSIQFREHTIEGIFVVSGGGTQTVEIQMATSGGSCGLQGGGLTFAGNQIEWLIQEL